ncbi:MAG: exodeoxyribonuclease VII large subunit [Desulfovibrionales bacterium]|nr:exodeoxyribonuclease VII large subunit [Desulfovibrionales bacterium]
MSQIFTVRELTDALKKTIEGAFPFVWVRGQVSNLSRPASGHLYFSLKDTDAVLNCVWFKGHQRGDEKFDPLTGEVFEDGPKPSLARTMQDGTEIMCAGRLNVYPPRGSYQLVVELAQDVGLGQLFMEFEELKRKLGAKGYFEPMRKRKLPYHPEKVAVVTAPSGAAIQDFLRISSTRGWGANIRIYPALVQGELAVAQLAKQVARVNAEGWADVIVLIRGGGSIEDLWAFNDEALADQIFGSRIPVVAGVGHEVDTTIADMTADVRAATPSHAAQLLWPERSMLEQSLDELEMRLAKRVEQQVNAKEHILHTLERGLGWLSPVQRLGRLDDQFKGLRTRLQGAMELRLKSDAQTVAYAQERISRAFGADALEQKVQAVGLLQNRLQWAGESVLLNAERRLERAAITLESLDPQKPLERGYSLVQRTDGTFVRSVEDVSVGEQLNVRVHDGVMDVRVENTTTGRSE